MGSIGNPIITGLVQAAQAQQVAARDRDRARSSESSAKERLDKLDLRVDETEAPEAVRDLRDEDERETPNRDQHPSGTDDGPADEAAPDPDPAAANDDVDDRPRLDLQA